MATLHTVNKSPFEKDSLSACLRLATSGAALVLFEDGVYGALHGTNVASQVRERLSELEVYCLEPDLKARGFTTDHLIAGIEPISYKGFVALAVAHKPVQAWL